MHRSIIAAASLVALAAAAQSPQPSPQPESGPRAAPPTLTAAFIDAQGRSVGKATLVKTPNGVLIEAELERLPPGEHGFHIHERGRCEPAGKFESAGGHFTPRRMQHGFLMAGGPHAGDMPNLFAAADGRARVHVFAVHVSLGQGADSLLDTDGSSIVVHAGADDYRSQPSGAAGARIACAVVAAPTP